jgi:presenilin-like A22 family membrane protease
MVEQERVERRELLPVFLMGCLFIIIHGLAMIVAGPFEAAGVEAFENPDDPMNLVIFFAIILSITAVILLIAKYWKKRVIQFIILFAVGYTSFYVFFPLLALVFNEWIAFFLAVAAALALTITLFKYPEWYVIDVSGIIVGAGAIAIFGISLGILLVLILLIGLAIYDAISVYKTKHMIDLADTVMDLKLPVLMVIPKIRHYSLIKETKSLKQKLKEKEERDAFFMGLGDIVMPGILVVATFHSPEGGLPIALSVMAGTLIGFLILMTFVMKGKPQAGLPCLCGGAILGYLISSYVFYGKLIGLSLGF